QLPQGLERRAQLRCEQLGLVPDREMRALVDLLHQSNTDGADDAMPEASDQGLEANALAPNQQVVARRAGAVKCYETITVGAAFVFRLLQCRYKQGSDVHERGEAWHRQRSTSRAQAAGIRVPPLHRRLRYPGLCN